MECIIYNNPDTGRVSIIYPASGHSVASVEHLVPSGLKYKYSFYADIPTDRTERNSWFIDEAELDRTAP